MYCINRNQLHEMVMVMISDFQITIPVSVASGECPAGVEIACVRFAPSIEVKWVLRTQFPRPFFFFFLLFFFFFFSYFCW